MGCFLYFTTKQTRKSTSIYCSFINLVPHIISLWSEIYMFLGYELYLPLNSPWASPQYHGCSSGGWRSLVGDCSCSNNSSSSSHGKKYATHAPQLVQRDHIWQGLLLIVPHKLTKKIHSLWQFQAMKNPKGNSFAQLGAVPKILQQWD